MNRSRVASLLLVGTLSSVLLLEAAHAAKEMGQRRVGYFTCKGEKWVDANCNDLCTKKSCSNLDRCKSCLQKSCNHGCGKRCKAVYTGDTVDCVK